MTEKEKLDQVMDQVEALLKQFQDKPHKWTWRDDRWFATL